MAPALTAALTAILEPVSAVRVAGLLVLALLGLAFWALLAEVLCGGMGGAAREVTENEMLALEREVLVSLCGEAKSLERMQYMLMNNKPIRN